MEDLVKNQKFDRLKWLRVKLIFEDIQLKINFSKECAKIKDI